MYRTTLLPYGKLIQCLHAFFVYFYNWYRNNEEEIPETTISKENCDKTKEKNIEYKHRLNFANGRQNFILMKIKMIYDLVLDFCMGSASSILACKKFFLYRLVGLVNPQIINGEELENIYWQRIKQTEDYIHLLNLGWSHQQVR